MTEDVRFYRRGDKAIVRRVAIISSFIFFALFPMYEGPSVNRSLSSNRRTDSRENSLNPKLCDLNRLLQHDLVTPPFNFSPHIQIFWFLIFLHKHLILNEPADQPSLLSSFLFQQSQSSTTLLLT